MDEYIDPLEALAKLLRSARASTPISLKEMSHRVGVSIETLRSWEGYAYAEVRIPSRERLTSLATHYCLPLELVTLAFETARTARDNMKNARRPKKQPRTSVSTGLSGGICSRSILRNSESRVYHSRLR